LVSVCLLAGAVGCGNIKLAPGTDGAAGSPTGRAGSSGGLDGGSGGATAGGGGSAGGAGSGAGSGGSGGASAGTGGMGGTGGTGGSTGGGGTSGGAGSAGTGVDAAVDGGVDTTASDASPRCDAGFTHDGGGAACVPIGVVIGSTTPCSGGGDVIYFDGDPNNYIFKGMQTVTMGKWSATSSATQVHVHVDPTDTKQGLWWDLYFDSSKLDHPLVPQVYTNAMRWPFQTAGHPGLDVSGDGRGCNTVTGSFQIEDIVTTDSGLASFTATFEHHCEGGASAVRGCVHFEM
jgi:hypothetical protein